MNITIFTYDHPHRKTYEILTQMLIHDFKPEMIYAQPWEARFPKPEVIQLGTKLAYYPHPHMIANAYDIPYEVTEHKDVRGGDLGVILGAGILPAEVIDSFKKGIVNIHPGALPENRGLDNVKWAALKKIRQAVTAHFIDDRIDRGRFILEREVATFDDDTLWQIDDRVMRAQGPALIHALDLIQQGFGQDIAYPLGKGDYHTKMPNDLELRLVKQWRK